MSFFQVPSFVYNMQKTDADWNYTTFSDGKSCLGLRDNRCSWSKGKGLGGSSSINAMFYIKGHPTDYDSWEELGNIGWGHDELEPYFENIENKFDLHNYKFNDDPLYNLLEDAYKELGVSPSAKLNDKALLGTRLTKMLVRKGRRLNTAKIYLSEAKRLHIMKNTLVRKIIIDPESKITVGVEVQRANGAIKQIWASKEVILSAGTIGTPQILMLSGVGPVSHLKDNNVEPILDLPVGKNLQDHVFMPFYFTTKRNCTITPEVFTMFIMEYILMNTGPLSTLGIADFMAFINTDNHDNPNIQFHHFHLPINNRIALETYLNNTGYVSEVVQAINKLNEEKELIGIYATLLRPKSRGEILLTNDAVTSKPIIKTNYFQSPEDVKQLIEGLRFIMKLETTNPFKSIGAKHVQIDLPFCSEITYNSDAYWECYIRHMATTVFHPVGTAKMGRKENEDSVVNHELLVHGIKKLRVVDASVMPLIVGANTMATTLGIAEKAVDMIIRYHSIKDEL